MISLAHTVPGGSGHDPFPRIKSLSCFLNLEGTLWGEGSRDGERTGVGMGERKATKVLGTGELEAGAKQLEVSATES